MTAHGAKPAAASKAAEGLVRRGFLGALSNFAEQAIVAAGQLLLLPVFLSYWGTARYGEWLILTSAVAYLWMLDLGVQTYAVNRLTQEWARGDRAQYARTLHTALTFTTLTAGAGFLVFAPAVLWAPWPQWFRIETTPEWTARFTALLLVAQIAINVPLGVLGGIYRSIGEYPRNGVISNFHRALSLALTFAAVVMGGGMLQVVAGQMTALLAISLAYCFYDLRKRHADIEIGWKLRDWELAKSFIGASSLFLVIQMSAAVALQGSTLAVSALYGATAVAVFGSFRTLTSLARQATMAVQRALWPDVTRLEAQGELTTLANLHVMLAKILLAMAAAVGLALVRHGDDIVRLWSRGRIGYDAGLMAGLVALLIAQTWSMASSLLLQSSNRHGIVALTGVLSPALGLLAGLTVWRSSGPQAIAWSMAAFEFLLTGLMIPAAACRLTGQRVDRMVFEVAGRGIGASLAVLGAVAFAAQLTASMPAGAQALAGLATLSATAPIAWFWIWLNATERAMIRARVTPFFARLRGTQS